MKLTKLTFAECGDFSLLVKAGSESPDCHSNSTLSYELQLCNGSVYCQILNRS